MKKFWGLLLIFGMLTLTACGEGGGDDDSGPVTSTETFQLKNAWINSVSNSSSTPFTISGTSSGFSITGSGTATESSLTNANFEGISCKKTIHNYYRNSFRKQPNFANCRYLYFIL